LIGLKSPRQAWLIDDGGGAACLGPAHRMEAGMTFRPLGDRILVRRVEEDAKTPGGIIIPDTAKEKPQQGEVLAVGPGARDKDGRRIEPELKAGQKVLFGKWSGSEVRINGEDLLIMKESDVLGVLDAA